MPKIASKPPGTGWEAWKSVSQQLSEEILPPDVETLCECQDLGLKTRALIH